MLRRIAIPVLVVSISSDVLYPPDEQIELAQRIPTAQCATVVASDLPLVRTTK